MCDSYPEKMGNNYLGFSRLTDKQFRQIHHATLEVLERTGVRLHLQEAVDLLERAGARVSDGNRVYIPHKLVEESLQLAPGQISIFDRLCEEKLILGTNNYYYGPGSDCMFIIDHRTGQRRKPVLEDVKEGTILCDYLDRVDFVMSMVYPDDVEQSFADGYQMEVMINNTIKPLVFVSYDYQGARSVFEMGAAVAGGEDKLINNPFLICLVNPVSGLKHNKESLQKLLYCAEKKLPVIYAPGARGGLTAPVTPAATTVVGLAGMFAGLVLSQLKNPGTPFIASGVTGTSIDFKTMVSPYANPAAGIGHEMIHYYQLPNWNIGGVTDSKTLDQQSTAEAALTLMTGVLSGGHLIHDMGYLEQGFTYSFLQLVLCNELAGWIDHYINTPAINDETLALNLINEIGPEGDFIDTEHTCQHFKVHWYSDLFERQSFEQWTKKGMKCFSERASSRIDNIISEHKPETLPGNIRDCLTRIVSSFR